MVKVIKLANAMAVVAGAAYVICRLLAFIAPGFLLSIAQSWFHTFNLSATEAVETSVGLFVLGLVSSMVVAWVWTYAVAALYSRWAGK